MSKGCLSYWVIVCEYATPNQLGHELPDLGTGHEPRDLRPEAQGRIHWKAPPLTVTVMCVCETRGDQVHGATGFNTDGMASHVGRGTHTFRVVCLSP